ncbi:MAG TPA: hypothetical protein VE821_05790 [Pyrinomonadaceae bacterium]|nr:hypothetical protein [Pyrinomonadaceae bacterium]
MSLIAIAIIFVVLAVVLAFARRTIRFFIKLVLVGVLLLALLVGFAWWRWHAGTSAPHNERQPSVPARRTH